jgi:nitrate/nitrite-specific signal transduction histidine kinase
MADTPERRLLERVAEESNRARPLPELLDFVLAQVETEIGFTWAAIWLFDREEESWYVAVSRGLSQEATEVRFPRAFTFPCLVGERGEPLLIEDLEQERFHRLVADHYLMRSALYAPMSIAGRPSGVIALYSDRTRAFTQADLNVLTTIGEHLGLAVAFATLEEQRARLAILEERERLAKDLHDGMLQVLSSMRIYTSELRRAANARDEAMLAEVLEQLDGSVDSAIAETRQAIARFRLESAYEQVTDVAPRTAARLADTGIETKLTLGVDELPGPISDALSWICREAANNILKHSNAAHAFITLQPVPGGVELCVGDDGVGLGRKRPANGQLHLGMQVMQERAAALRGTLSVESSGPGVTIRCRIATP